MVCSSVFIRVSSGNLLSIAPCFQFGWYMLINNHRVFGPTSIPPFKVLFTIKLYLLRQVIKKLYLFHVPSTTPNIYPHSEQRYSRLNRMALAPSSNAKS